MWTKVLETSVYVSIVFTLPYSMKNLRGYLKMHMVSRIKKKIEAIGK